MKAFIIAFCVILVIVNSLAAPKAQTFVNSPADRPDGGWDTSPRKGKREPGLPIPQSELHDDKAEPNMQTYFRDSPNGGTHTGGARKGKRESMWSGFDRKAKELEKILKDSHASSGNFQKRQVTSGNTKTIWEDFVDALQM